eukprot:g39274.t1
MIVRALKALCTALTGSRCKKTFIPKKSEQLLKPEICKSVTEPCKLGQVANRCAKISNHARKLHISPDLYEKKETKTRNARITDTVNFTGSGLLFLDLIRYQTACKICAVRKEIAEKKGSSRALAQQLRADTQMLATLASLLVAFPAMGGGSMGNMGGGSMGTMGGGSMGGGSMSRGSMSGGSMSGGSKSAECVENFSFTSDNFNQGLIGSSSSQMISLEQAPLENGYPFTLDNESYVMFTATAYRIGNGPAIFVQEHPVSLNLGSLGSAAYFNQFVSEDGTGNYPEGPNVFKLFPDFGRGFLKGKTGTVTINRTGKLRKGQLRHRHSNLVQKNTLTAKSHSDN